MDRIDADVNRSNEDFIKHYNSKYDNPSMPPSWMALEVVSFATLSRLFQSLRLDSRKEYITEQFGLKKVAILENWLHSISNLRNCCAHHSRVWNRRFMVSVILPYILFIPLWIELQSDKYAQTNYLPCCLVSRIYLILSVQVATSKRISKSCSNPIAVCSTSKIWDSLSIGNLSPFGGKIANFVFIQSDQQIVNLSVPVILDSSSYRVCYFNC